jgi:hypothetical protein
MESICRFDFCYLHENRFPSHRLCYIGGIAFVVSAAVMMMTNDNSAALRTAQSWGLTYFGCFHNLYNGILSSSLKYYAVSECDHVKYIFNNNYSKQIALTDLSLLTSICSMRDAFVYTKNAQGKFIWILLGLLTAV